MSGGITIGFVDLAVFLFQSDRVHCASVGSFLVRNWCGHACLSRRAGINIRGSPSPNSLHDDHQADRLGPLKANKTLHLPAFFLAKGSAFASGDVPESLLAEEFFAKAMMQARQEIALPFELRAGLELGRIWIGRGEPMI